MRTYLSLFPILSLLAVVAAASPKFADDPSGKDLLKAISKPRNQQDEFTRKAAEKLEKSRVPTAKKAESLALGAFIPSPGLDAREKLDVAGLYHVGRDVPQFAKEGDLFWEVRITRLGSGLSGIVWVSTTTGAARVLFPPRP